MHREATMNPDIVEVISFLFLSNQSQCLIARIDTLSDNEYHTPRK